MPNLAPITVNDGASTPVAHVFTPAGMNGNQGVLYERSGSAMSQPVLRLSNLGSVEGKAVTRVGVNLVVPHTAVENGQEVLRYYDTFKGEFMLSEKSVKQDRKNLRMLIVNALQTATLVSMIDDLEGLW